MLEGYEEFGMDRCIDEEMMEVCLICGGSLVGVLEQVVLEYVNVCLDGNLMLLLQFKLLVVFEENKEIDGVEVGKRFVKVVVFRLGQVNFISFGEKILVGSLGLVFVKFMFGYVEDIVWVVVVVVENVLRGMLVYKWICLFYKIMFGFLICVDVFRYGVVEGCKVYFFSYFYSDYYIGFMVNWIYGLIYCSKVMGLFVKIQLKIVVKYVVEFEFDKIVLVLYIKGVIVIMIFVNYCFGSFLFLFEKVMGGGKIYWILYCGDF